MRVKVTRYRWIGLIVTSWYLLACSHAPSASDIPPNVSFVTKILGDDTKLFTYTVHRARGGPDGGEDLADMPSRGGMRGGPDRDAPSSKVMLRGAEAMLAQNNYCREGYMVLEQYEQHGSYIVRGECRDAATSGDRDKFNINK